MKISATLKRLFASGVLLAGALVSASSAFAQGCALCYADAAASGPQTQAALRHGILVLMIPPMIIFAGFFFLLYKRSNLRRESLRDLQVAAHVTPESAPEFILHLN